MSNRDLTDGDLEAIFETFLCRVLHVIYVFSLVQRVSSLVVEMGELVSAECRRQGAWGVLGEGTGAKLLCPDTGAVLAKEEIIGEPQLCLICSGSEYFLEFSLFIAIHR